MGVKIVGNYRYFNVRIRHVSDEPVEPIEPDLPESQFLWDLANLEVLSHVVTQEPDSLIVDVGDHFYENPLFKSFSSDDAILKSISTSKDVYIWTDVEIVDDVLFKSYSDSDATNKPLSTSNDVYIVTEEEIYDSPLFKSYGTTDASIKTVDRSINAIRLIKEEFTLPEFWNITV